MQEKKCNKCGQIKQLSDFNKASTKKCGVQSACKECTRKDSNERYKDNSKYRERIRRNNKESIVKNKEYIKNFLKEHPCVDCGESDLVVLEFDHVRGEKSFNISSGIRGQGLSSIKEEIEKCEVRCANCHRKKTSKERSWFKELDKKE